MAERLSFIPPMTPKLVMKPPEGDDWIHEVKLDGYRAQVVINGPDDIRVFTKSGADWTTNFKGIAEAARELDVKNAILDGEAVVTNAAGLPDFPAMQRTVHKDPFASILGAFDILHLDGHDLRDIGCKARREMLFSIIKPNSRIQFSEALPGDGKSAFFLVDQAGLEGIVSKRAGSKYRSGPTSNWVKTKSYVISELELLGVQRERGQAALALMGEPGTRKYVGSAIITAGRETRERLWKRVQEHAAPAVKDPKRPAVQWLKPGLMAPVKHLRGELMLRHATLQDFSE